MPPPPPPPPPLPLKRLSTEAARWKRGRSKVLHFTFHGSRYVQNCEIIFPRSKRSLTGGPEWHYNAKKSRSRLSSIFSVFDLILTSPSPVVLGAAVRFNCSFWRDAIKQSPGRMTPRMHRASEPSTDDGPILNFLRGFLLSLPWLEIPVLTSVGTFLTEDAMKFHSTPLQFQAR